MLENYRMDEYGNIHQQHITPYHYGIEYNDQYNHGTYKQNSYILNTLRLSMIIMNIPKEYQNSILDVGYGSGDFLRIANMRFPACYGYDVSPFPIPDCAIRVNNLSEAYYDVITFWDSLEHIENLDFLSNLKCKYLFISAPYCHYSEVENPDWWMMNWKHLKPNEHIHHFNPQSLANLLRQYGYLPVAWSFFSSSINNDVEDIVRKPKDKLQNIFTSYFYKTT